MKPGHAASNRRFPASRLADERDTFPPRDRKRDALDGSAPASAVPVSGLELGDLEQWRGLEAAGGKCACARGLVQVELLPAHAPGHVTGRGHLEERKSLLATWLAELAAVGERAARGPFAHSHADPQHPADPDPPPHA